MSNYSWNDFWTTSPLEGVRNAYSKADDSLALHLRYVYDYMDYASTHIGKWTINIKSATTDSSGSFVELVNQKRAKIQTELDKLMHASWDIFPRYRNQLSETLKVVRNRLATLQDFCRQEDANEKELPLYYLPF